MILEYRALHGPARRLAEGLVKKNPDYQEFELMYDEWAEVEAPLPDGTTILYELRYENTGSSNPNQVREWSAIAIHKKYAADLGWSFEEDEMMSRMCLNYLTLVDSLLANSRHPKYTCPWCYCHTLRKTAGCTRLDCGYTGRYKGKSKS